MNNANQGLRIITSSYMATKTQWHEVSQKTYFLLKKLCVSWCLSAFVAKTFLTLDPRE